MGGRGRGRSWSVGWPGGKRILGDGRRWRGGGEVVGRFRHTARNASDQVYPVVLVGSRHRVGAPGTSRTGSTGALTLLLPCCQSLLLSRLRSINCTLPGIAHRRAEGFDRAINQAIEQSTATRLILNHRPVRPEISPQAKRIQDDRSGAARRRADGSTGQAGQAIINSIDASDQSSFQLNQCSQFKQSSNLQPRAQSTAINQSSRVLKYPGRKSAQVACSLARLSIRLILEARLQANPERCRATKPTINSS